MARTSRWSQEQRAQILKMVKSSVAEQDIRAEFTTQDKDGGTRAMTAVEFAQQLKQSMVESGEIKQAVHKTQAQKKSIYEVTATGRLTINDFSDLTGSDTGGKFTLEKPRGRSNAWRLVPAS